MNKKKVILLIVILFINPIIISAECTENQININTASKSELQEIDNIGPVYSEQIINLRKEKLFENLDELTRVNGIAETRLNQIKNQGLACVENNEKENSSNKEGGNNDGKEDTKKEAYDFDFKKNIKENKTKKENPQNKITSETIVLSLPDSEKENTDPKVIKKPNSFNFKENKSKYANYGLIIVTVLVTLLMLIKYRKNKYKNEFRE